MKRSSIIILAKILAVISILLISGCAKKFILRDTEKLQANPWPFVRGDTDAFGRIDSDYGGQLNIKWERRFSDGPIAPMTIAAGKVIYSGNKRHIYFVDSRSGKYDGKYNIRKNSTTGVVVIDSLAYYGLSHPENEFVCTNILSRKKLWKRRLKDVTGSPIIIENRLWIGSATGMVYCFNRLTGDTMWSDSAGAKSIAGPSGNGEIIVFPFDDGKLKAYQPETGEIIFETELDRPLLAKVVVGERLYLTGATGSLIALERDGTMAWSKNFGSPLWTTPAADKDRLYIGDNGGTFRAVRASDGHEVWNFEANGVITASAIIVGDYVLFGTLTGEFYCLDKNSGVMVAQREFKKEVRYPAVSDGELIYVASGDGTIHAFGD
jgi:outer membrane protein assembly factor BamB